MDTTHPITFNSRTLREIKMFIEMISDVYNNFEDVKWSNKSGSEIGFYYRHKQKKTEYFFGIWYNAWKQFGIPLSLSLNYYGKAPIEWHNKLRKYIFKNYAEGIATNNYEIGTCVLFEYSFF